MTIPDFIKDWSGIRGKTIEFMEGVPDDKMTWRPHEELGTFGMQLRHLIKSQEAYIFGMKNGRIDFSDKTFDRELETNRQKAVARIKKLDTETISFLNKADENTEVVLMDGVFGEKKISLATVLDYMINHEIYHQGILTCYGRLAGLGKFVFM